MPRASTRPETQECRELRRMARQAIRVGEAVLALVERDQRADARAIVAVLATTLSRGLESLETPPHSAAPGTSDAEDCIPPPNP